MKKRKWEDFVRRPMKFEKKAIYTREAQQFLNNRKVNLPAFSLKKYFPSDQEQMSLELPEFDFEPALRAQEASLRKLNQKVECKQKKQVICQYWWRARAGRSAGCMKGEACDFLHEMRYDLIPICIHFLEGKCNRPNCIFRHEKKQICHAFERGFCKYGAQCVWEHVEKGPMCPNQYHYGYCWVKDCKKPHPRQDPTFWKLLSTFSDKISFGDMHQNTGVDMRRRNKEE